MTNPFLSAAKLFGYVEPMPMTHWQDKVVEFATTKYEKNQVMFMGDSITEGWASTQYLKGYINFGVAGDMTNGTLALMNLVEKVEPKKVIVNIGTNDIGFNIPQATTEANYRKLTMRLGNKVGAENVVCCAIRPINNMLPMARNRNNVIIKSYNGMIKNICTANGYIFEPETYPCHNIVTMGMDFLNPYHTVDGLHLSPLGYQKEFEIIQKYLV
jgi:lysophospholipase L1-like esterase